jgi:hypothetical protein
MHIAFIPHSERRIAGHVFAGSERTMTADVFELSEQRMSDDFVDVPNEG